MGVQIYHSSVSGNIHVKKQQQQIQSFLEGRKLPFELIDVAADEQAKEYMRRKSGKTTIPQIFVDGEFRGLYEDFENAIEEGAAEALFK